MRTSNNILRITHLFAPTTLERICLCLHLLSTQSFEQVLFPDSTVCRFSLFGSHFLRVSSSSAAFLKGTEAHIRTALDILQNRATGKSPATTLSRRPGLFLSFRLTKSDRILALYAVLTPPLSSTTIDSIAFAFPRICSDAEPRVRRGNAVSGCRQLTGSGVKGQCIVYQLQALISGCISRHLDDNDTIGLRCSHVRLDVARRATGA